MQLFSKYFSIWLPVLLLAGGVAVLFPWCQYFIDPDATAYLSIARRYAEGDLQRAINGYWSPWACWLTALGIRAGMGAFAAAIVVNTLGALGFLLAGHALMRRLSLPLHWINWLMPAFGLFLAYAVYKQSFDDLWQCCWLITALLLMLQPRFLQRPALWVLYGFVAALAYMAKAYAFPFMILFTACGLALQVPAQGGGWKPWLRPLVLSMGVMLICSLPWLWMLHGKYGIWTTGTAGSLNLSWYLVGHPYWKEGIALLLPPVYPDSPYYWEDPYVANGPTPHFWSSGRLMALQLVRMGYNGLKFLNSLNELSALMLPAMALSVLVLLHRRLRAWMPDGSRLAALFVLLFPAGFILINYEARYLWPIVPVGMALMALALQHLWLWLGPGLLRRLLPALVALSFISWPVYDLKHIAGQGRAEYVLARQLKALGLSGSFTSNEGPEAARRLGRLAYFWGQPYYVNLDAGAAPALLLQELRRYKVKYYLYCGLPPGGGPCVFTDEQGRAFPEVSGGRVPGLKVFELY